MRPSGENTGQAFMPAAFVRYFRSSPREVHGGDLMTADVGEAEDDARAIGCERGIRAVARDSRGLNTTSFFSCVSWITSTICGEVDDRPNA